MDDLRSLTSIILMAPLIGAIIAGLFGRLIGRKASHLITTGLVGLAFLISSYLLFGFFKGSLTSWDGTLYVWGTLGSLDIVVGCLLDQLSVLMITVVSFISLLVHVYSIGYMHDDPGYQRFFSYISLFTFSMLMLVLANNFMQIFFGWEAVGLVSYLLIGFWFKKPTANYASLKAFIVNRVGDFGFILGIAAIFKLSGTLQYATVFSQMPQLAAQQTTIDLICFALFVGAMAKSAQIPLHVWLPDSMEGPTPISALIHAATMVTAGVYMVARMSPIFEYSISVLTFITIIGTLTMLLMGFVAIVQTDIKRIIAYSTLSQLGVMVIALGISAYSVSIFHLVTHAFYKALLFLAAGSIITVMHHEQDIMRMGALRQYLPITFATMLIGSLALVGFPGTAGFYSKDLIIELVGHSSLAVAPFAYYSLLIGVFVTGLYSFRLLALVFFTQDRTIDIKREHLHEPSMYIWIPLVVLAVPSVFIGGLLINTILNNFFGATIFIAPEHNVVTDFAQNYYHGAISMLLHGFISLPFMMVVLAALVTWWCYVKQPNLPNVLIQRGSIVYKILMNKYGFDWFNQTLILPSVRKLGTTFWKLGDVFCIDGIMINGSVLGVGLIAARLRKLQSGYLYQYAFAMITALVLLLLWIFYV